MNTKSDNIETVMDSETNYIIEKLCESLLQKCQKDWKNQWDEANLFPIVLLYCITTLKIGLKRSRSYIDSPKWLKNKKATINQKNNDDNCFQYALTVALNYQNIKNNLERISKVNPFLINIIGKK